MVYTYTCILTEILMFGHRTGDKLAIGGDIDTMRQPCALCQVTYMYMYTYLHVHV